MTHQKVLSSKRMKNTLYDFMEYKKRKPFFRKPIKITVGNTINDSYYMVKNVVFNEKQILALKKEQDSNTIILVEGKIVDGKLMCISRLSEECLGDIGRMLVETI